VREPDHDDIMQMAFEQLVQTLVRQRFARACSLETWAARVANYVGLAALRSRRRQRRWLDHYAEITTSLADQTILHWNPEPAMEARWTLDRVRRHLVAMKPEQAETVFLSWTETSLAAVAQSKPEAEPMRSTVDGASALLARRRQLPVDAQAPPFETPVPARAASQAFG